MMHFYEGSLFLIVFIFIFYTKADIIKKDSKFKNSKAYFPIFKKYLFKYVLY